MTDTTKELSVTRYIAASPETVWQVLTDRQEEWWCPKPWRAEIDKQDRRPGGVCNMTFYGPDGEVSPQNGIYLAYAEGRRFVTTAEIGRASGREKVCQSVSISVDTCSLNKKKLKSGDHKAQ